MWLLGSVGFALQGPPRGWGWAFINFDFKKLTYLKIDLAWLMCIDLVLLIMRIGNFETGLGFEIMWGIIFVFMRFSCWLVFGSLGPFVVEIRKVLRIRIDIFGSIYKYFSIRRLHHKLRNRRMFFLLNGVRGRYLGSLRTGFVRNFFRWRRGLLTL